MRLIAPYLIPYFLRLGARLHPDMLWRLADPASAALTFDDGPSRFTPGLLDALEAEGVRATFFVLGDRCRRYPDLIARMQRAGHTIALHGDRHIAFSSLRLDELHASWEANRSAIIAAGGMPAPLVRPPYGLAGTRERGAATDAGLRIVQMSLLPGRHILLPPAWEEPPDLMAHRIARELHPGAILTLHDGESTSADDGVFDQPQVAETARRAIHEMRARGLRLIPLAP
jgi:peptidoglycan/xylan/chitin deacetylase (PgdA/CDA1 family)